MLEMSGKKWSRVHTGDMSLRAIKGNSLRDDRVKNNEIRKGIVEESMRLVERASLR